MSIIEKSVLTAEKRAHETAKPDKTPPKAAPVPRESDTSSAVFAGQFETQLTDPVFVNQFRQLKRSILRASFGPLAEPGANLLIITSALPNAGKTFIARNVAQALSHERDRNVLLVDTDNAKRTLTNALELNDRPGFFDLLSDESLSIDELIVHTPLPNLDVMAAGGRYADSSELLSSRRAKAVVTRLAQDDPDRLVIFDAPPLLATPDAPALADLGGLFLLVVEAGATTRRDIEQALEIFGEKNTVGLILNKATKSSSSLLGYYGRHYGADDV